MQFNIPTCLTLFRVVLIPFFVLAFYLPFHWAPFATALLFVIAAVTDWFDGFLARRWKQTTRFGAFLDPVADKVMVAMALVLVAEYFHARWITLPAATMIAREIIISALREWMAEIGKQQRGGVVDWQSEDHGADAVAGGAAMASGCDRSRRWRGGVVHRSGADFLVNVPVFARHAAICSIADRCDLKAANGRSVWIILLTRCVR